MDKATFLRRTELAVRAFYENDIKLIELEVHERTIAHRFAIYLEDMFRGWNIDCEYNRLGIITKGLDGVRECDSQRATDRIYPDIIIHERGSEDRNNLGVIEIKARREIEACDRQKLELMTRRTEDDKFKYEFGAFFAFYLDRCKWILFVSGREDEHGIIEVG